MLMPDVLIVENCRTMNRLGILDTLGAIGLPCMASAFGIFLLRQIFKTVPKELDEAARGEGAGSLEVLWKAYGLASVSYHWNNLLWPLALPAPVRPKLHAQRHPLIPRNSRQEPNYFIGSRNGVSGSLV